MAGTEAGQSGRDAQAPVKIIFVEAGDAEVKAEVAAELGDTPDTMRRSLALLESISRSLGGDAPG